MRKLTKLFGGFIGLILSWQLQASDNQNWYFNNLTKVGGYTTKLEGQPKITESGNSVLFNGNNERMHLEGNIIAGMQAFTLELIAKPLTPTEKGREPRIVHIENPENPKHRLTLEMRFNDKNEWYLDAFLMDGDSRYTLIDSQFTHPINQWFNIAITYQNGKFSSFVNGKQELSNTVQFSPMAKVAHTSVGARMNQVHYFHGEIKQLRATNRVLTQAEMLKVIP
ncbi:LamG domain-containing protein [Catenovulum sp. 2E275]|uniref:LamG domain-containing protein n=1 Tax=Catenovulum sp. 2E275 TaxID=2980497 RepID=UPI0021D1B4C3|nr:LamG domain-containing protein [Catenovulum sp. 2E275]MCU4677015.1 LamG domain-containing protein [Catenovulum sp. 2E275]